VVGCSGREKFSPFVDRLLLWRQTAKVTWQIALCFTLKFFENPKSFYSTPDEKLGKPNFGVCQGDRNSENRILKSDDLQGNPTNRILVANRAT
jgi:hypothetical protein